MIVSDPYGREGLWREGGKVDWPNGLEYMYLCGFSVCGDTGIALLCCFGGKGIVLPSLN